MQDSAKRLLDAARDERSAVVCRGFGELQTALGVSPAVMTNWKARGVSEKGALKAEAVLGCSAHWVLAGMGEMFPGRLAISTSLPDRAVQGVEQAPAENSRPPVIAEDEWKSLSPRARSLVEDTARQAQAGRLTDQQVKVLHDLLEQIANPKT